ncbi:MULTISPECIES: LPS export ABC transporter periplasmic protein LptC [unclassified Campylobacter]|uniref:LPS export ABC transporter periplasmic protein LptC n=2 Tax=Campylobacter TaxID=194 RepID=UPI001BDAAE90|nr:LPS export ABC transporter periplasmic protein LptC [Campylobacter sp. 2018MI01]MBT0885155.1 LPS export ABC transporter periplasmic protein LptC [Campylobacter sp. 2018MI10]MBZ7978217.1 LPS export ABC transporter periplasmic protein LptC [Campylobacter sp. RM12654]MBZ7980228.1 LPS export ABC transporter periplasmic protein LptC [Campylobacter sp. RM12642]MBZ7983672.1 LPS export ABC transporter periplasmic protein LptC [Campylobacter sp. RM12647]
MLIKTFNIILVSMLSMLFFIIIQKPYDIDKMNYQLDFKSLEANDIIGYELSNKLEKIAYAKQYYKINNQDNLIDLSINDLEKHLSSNKATKENNIIVLNGDVKYKDNLIKLESDVLNYSINEKILSSLSKTKVTYNNSLINANSFSYNLNSSDLLLKEVDLCIEK